MSQVQLNIQGLLESIEERLAQIEALVSSAHRTISSYEASLYMQEAAELLQLARELVQEARNCSSSLSAQLAARRADVVELEIKKATGDNLWPFCYSK
ncbi:Uncharacterised protein [Klebsiella pneumoniae]|nr:Uncharacterised protein [Klebsiella pneumoniae]